MTWPGSRPRIPCTSTGTRAGDTGWPATRDCAPSGGERAWSTAIDGTGWYPDLVRSFVMSGLERLGASPSCWRDVLLADLATTAATADHDEFARNHLLLFRRLTGGQS